MGTNFYKIIPVKQRTLDNLKDKIDKEEFTINKYGEVEFNNIEELELQPNEIHIGKRSGGWKFLFDCNDWKYFAKTEKSLLDWIYDDSDGSIIRDEYGTVYTREQFMQEVNDTYDTPWINGKERWDHQSYIKEHPNECHYYNSPLDMYLGKYRVSTYTDFS